MNINSKFYSKSDFSISHAKKLSNCWKLNPASRSFFLCTNDLPLYQTLDNSLMTFLVQEPTLMAISDIAAIPDMVKLSTVLIQEMCFLKLLVVWFNIFQPFNIILQNWYKNLSYTPKF